MNPAVPGLAGPPVSDAQAMSGMIQSLGPQTPPQSSMIPGPMAPPAPMPPAPTPTLDFGDTPGSTNIIQQQPLSPYYPPAPTPGQQQFIPQQSPQYPPQPGFQGQPQQGGMIPGGMPMMPQPGTFQQPAQMPQQQPQGDIIPVVPIVPVAPPAPLPQLPAAPAANDNEPPAWAKSMQDQLAELRQSSQADWNTVLSGKDANGNPRNWNDVQKLVESAITQGVAAEIAKMGGNMAQQPGQPQAQAPDPQQLQAAANQYLDGQINQLTYAGRLPQVVNQADYNDPGRTARRELYAYALKLGTDNLLQAHDALSRYHQSGYFYDHTKFDPTTNTTGAFVRRNSQGAAAQAPIAGASPQFNNGGMAQRGPSMRDLATKDLSALADDAARMIM